MKNILTLSLRYRLKFYPKCKIYSGISRGLAIRLPLPTVYQCEKDRSYVNGTSRMLVNERERKSLSQRNENGSQFLCLLPHPIETIKKTFEVRNLKCSSNVTSQ